MTTAFISYSRESQEHMDWVARLATDLRAAGIEVWLDQWHVRLGDSLTEFMERCVAEADYVLLICTEAFGGKANSRSGGVGYEQAIVTSYLLNTSPAPGRFVCILRSGAPSRAIPLYMQSRLWLDLQDSADYRSGLEQLLKHLRGRYEDPRPVTDPDAVTPHTAPEADPVPPRGWVLVAGTGPRWRFSEGLEETARRLGSQLAAHGYGLVTGGWPGVDEIVARAFWETAAERKLAPEDRLIQVVVEDRNPTFTAGQLFFVRGDEEWSEPIRRADVVMLLGGVGGTWETGERALKERKPVLPFASTGGDAEKFYLRMLRDWDSYQWVRLSRERFNRVGRPGPSAADAAIELLPDLIARPAA